MIALPATVLLICFYAIVRRRWAGLTMPAGAGRLFDDVWRRRGRIAGDVDGRDSVCAFWFGLLDRVVPLRADSIPIVITVCHIAASVFVYGATSRFGDSRTAFFATASYMLVTVMPQSWSYVSLPAAIASVVVAATSFFVALVFPAVLVPYAVLFVMAAFAVVAVNVRRIFRKSAMRVAYGAVGPFFEISAPFWAFAIAGIAVAGFGVPVIVCVLALAAAMAVTVPLVPSGFLLVLPLASPFAGIALERTLFAPGINSVQAVTAVWAIACLYALIVRAKRGSDGGTLDDVTARTCGEYIERHASPGSTVLNATGLSSLFLYAAHARAVGRSAWLGCGTPPVVSGETAPDIILTDETACSIMSIADTEPYDLVKVFDGRIAMFARAGVMKNMPVPARDRTVLSIIVVTHNRADLTDRCLRSIRRTVDVFPELVVVDSGSTDSTVEMLEGMDDLQLVRLDENCGTAVAVNAGVDVLEGNGPLLLLHNDVVLTQNCVSRMIDAMGRTDADAVGPVTNVARRPQCVPGGPFRHVMELESYAAAVGRADSGRIRNTDALAGFCMLVKRSVFEDVDGFDESYKNLLYADADFCRRLADRNARLVVAKDAFVLHQGAAGWSDHPSDLAETFNRSIHRFSTKWSVVPELDMADELRATGLRKRAAKLLAADKPVDALKSLVEAARVLPNDATLINDIGTVLWTLGEHERGLKNFQRAVELLPGLESAASNLTSAADALDRSDETKVQLDAAHRITNLGLAL